MASDVIFYIGIDMKQRIMLESDHDDLYYYQISYAGSGGYSYHQIFLGLQVLQGIPIWSKCMIFFKTNFLTNNIYKYTFSGTSHADDIFFLFYPRVVNISDAPSSYFLVVDRMVTMWTNFAKYRYDFSL